MKLPKFLLPPSVKSSRASHAILMGVTMPGPISHAPYGVLAKESYERNITIYSCVNEIGQAVSSVPWILQKRGGAGTKKFSTRMMTERTARKAAMFRGVRRRVVIKALETTEVENHPALTLIEKPNPHQAQAEYMIQKVSYFLLAGNGYEEFIAPNRKGATPMEMWNLRPDRVAVLPNTGENRARYGDLAKTIDPAELILGYLYTSSMKTEAFSVSSILHKKFFHPTDDYYGLSPLQVAARACRTDNLAADWNYALIKNQARPSGALIAPTAVGDDTYERIKMEIQDSYQGGSNAGMPLFLEGGLDWVPLGLSPLEMDWLASRRENRVELCAVYKTPPEIIGDSEHKTYNSFPEARRAFWMEAVLPILDSIRDSYNQRLIPLFGENYFLDYDRDQIDALVEEQKSLFDRMKVADHLSTNEKRDATGFESYDGDPSVDNIADVPTGLLPKEAIHIADPNVPENLGGSPAPVSGVKAQVLTRRQSAARAELKKAMAAHFRKQGSKLAAHLRAAINKLDEGK